LIFFYRYKWAKNPKTFSLCPNFKNNPKTFRSIFLEDCQNDNVVFYWGFPWQSSKKMSIALWRLNYAQSVAINTPSEAKKALGGFVYKKLFLLNGWRCCGH